MSHHKLTSVLWKKSVVDLVQNENQHSFTSEEKFLKTSTFKFRFEKFKKNLNFSFLPKNKKFGVKKMNILLAYLFCLIDKVNNSKENFNFAIVTQAEIAKATNSSVSWVKRVKKEFFTINSEENNKNFFQKYFGLESINKIFGWKNLLLQQQEEGRGHFENLEKERFDKNGFVSKSKCYVNFFTYKKNGKSIKSSYVGFSKRTFIKLESFFIKKMKSKKNSNKVKKSFLFDLFTKKKKWFRFKWMWKTIYFFSENFDFYKKKKKFI